MTSGPNGNDAVAFVVELGALTLIGACAWQSAPGPMVLRIGAVAAVVGSAIVLWGLCAAPKATFDVPALAVAVKVLVLGGSVVAAYRMLWTGMASAWALLVVVNTALALVGPFARR